MAKRPERQNVGEDRPQVRHERVPDFRTVYADGVLIRPQRNDLFITFFHDDAPVVSQGVEHDVDEHGRQQVRILDEYKQQFTRFHDVTVRMLQSDAVTMALLILTRIRQERPDVLKEMGIEFEPREGQK